MAIDEYNNNIQETNDCFWLEFKVWLYCGWVSNISLWSQVIGLELWLSFSWEAFQKNNSLNLEEAD